jgi:LPXTG-motif cell wall-anchored protein
MLASTTGMSPTVMYVAAGAGALLVVGLLLKKKKGAAK